MALDTRQAAISLSFAIAQIMIVVGAYYYSMSGSASNFSGFLDASCTAKSDSCTSFSFTAAGSFIPCCYCCNYAVTVIPSSSDSFNASMTQRQCESNILTSSTLTCSDYYQYLGGLVQSATGTFPCKYTLDSGIGSKCSSYTAKTTGTVSPACSSVMTVPEYQNLLSFANTSRLKQSCTTMDHPHSSWLRLFLLYLFCSRFECKRRGSQQYPIVTCATESELCPTIACARSALQQDTR